MPAIKPLMFTCRCCHERFHLKRTNPYCDWCRAECTNEGCIKPKPLSPLDSGSSLQPDPTESERN